MIWTKPPVIRSRGQRESSEGYNPVTCVLLTKSFSLTSQALCRIGLLFPCALTTFLSTSRTRRQTRRRTTPRPTPVCRTLAGWFVAQRDRRPDHFRPRPQARSTTPVSSTVVPRFSRAMPPIRDVARSAVSLLVLITSHRAFALEPGCPLASFDERARVGDALSAEFDAQGYDVQRGAMWVFTHADIEPDCQECSHANPSSTYGCAMLVRRGVNRPAVVVTPHTFGFEKTNSLTKQTHSQT